MDRENIDFGVGELQSFNHKIERCVNCNGTGIILGYVPTLNMKPIQVQKPCLECGGRGYKIIPELE